MLGELFLGRMHQTFGLVARLDSLAPFLVVCGVGFGVLHHLLDFGFGETAGGLDGDLLFLRRRLVARRHVDDTVGVDVERDLDLRHATRSRGDALEVEVAKQLVVRRHLALALQHADRHRRLVVVGGREDLRLLRRDGRVPIDQAREHAAQRLDAKRQRGHVEQHDVLHVPLQNAALDRRADGDDFIRVDALVRLLAEEGLHGFLNFRHARHATDEDDLIDLRDRLASVRQRLLARVDRALDEVLDEGLELCARQLHVEVDRAARARRDVGLGDVDLRYGGQFLLHLFRLGADALQRHQILAEVDAILFLELVADVFDQPVVEVLAAKEGVTIGGEHFEHAIADLEDRDVERAAAEVVHGDDLAAVLFLKPVSQRSRSRLVDDAENFKTRDAARILGRLALRVVEVGGNRDDGLRYLFAKIGLGGFLHLAEDEGGDFLGGVVLVAALNIGIGVGTLDDLVGDEVLVLLHHRIIEVTPDQALDGRVGEARVYRGLALGDDADEALARILKRHDGGGRSRPFRVLDDPCLSAVHDGHAGVGRPQIDADDLSHSTNVLSAAAAPSMVWA